MKIYNFLSEIKSREQLSNVKDKNDKAKLRNLSSQVPDKVNKSGHGAYIVNINKASESDFALKIDSFEQADQVIEEIKKNIDQNPAEAAAAHGSIDAGTSIGYWLKLLGY